MHYVKAKNICDKINVFCKTADVNQDGMLSYQEIYELSQICLSVFFKNNEPEDCVEQLC
jgi:hypothetical protein